MSFEKFKTFADLVKQFDTEAKCSQYLALQRWEGVPICPHCNSGGKVYLFSNGIKYKCGDCRKQFTVRVGTIFEDSKIPLVKWFQAMYLFACRSKPTSSMQLAKDIGVTQKSAWFLLHRLRFGAAHPDFKKPLENTTEVDESYVGGDPKNKHGYEQRKGTLEYAESKSKDKAVVFGIVERNQYNEVRREHKVIKGLTVREQVVVKSSTIVLKHVRSAKREDLHPVIISNVKEFSRVISDEWYAYDGLDKLSYMHATIKHALKQYIVGDIHTNTIENFWSVLKRGIYGTYHFTSKKHLQRYLEEFAHRFNSRRFAPNDKFDQLAFRMGAGHLEYRMLVREKII